MKAVAILIALLILADSPLSQTAVPWSDDFEQSTNPGYLPGIDPTGGSPPFISLGGWEQWDLGLNTGARISTSFANSGTQSLFNGGSSDIVQRFNVSSGQWLLRSMIYVPTVGPEEMTVETWYIWLNLYNHNGPKDWALQLDFHTNGYVKWGPSWATSPSINYTLNGWTEILTKVDLDTDRATIFINGRQLGATWQWSQGVSMSSNPPRLSALDLWSNLQNAGANPGGGASYDDHSVTVNPFPTFCTPKTMPCGPTSIRASGTPSSTQSSGFVVSVHRIRACRAGLLLYTNQPPVAAQPFGGPGNGALCLSGMGLRRAGPIESGGTPQFCDGILSIDMNQFRSLNWSASGCNPATGQNNPAAFLGNIGTTVNAQVWGRDSVAAGQVLSDGISWAVGP